MSLLIVFADMTPRKSRTCKVCKKKFQRPNNVTIHMRTAHKKHVKKLRCPICNELVSTIANMRVHLERESQKNAEKYKLRNGKVNGMAIKYAWVPAESLQHGRYYGSYSDSDSTSTAESEDAATAAATVKNPPKRKRGSKNSSAKKSRCAVETIEISDSSDWSESDNLPLARLIEQAQFDESMDEVESWQQLQGTILYSIGFMPISVSIRAIGFDQGNPNQICVFFLYFM